MYSECAQRRLGCKLCINSHNGRKADTKAGRPVLPQKMEFEGLILILAKLPYNERWKYTACK